LTLDGKGFKASHRVLINVMLGTRESLTAVADIALLLLSERSLKVVPPHSQNKTTQPN